MVHTAVKGALITAMCHRKTVTAFRADQNPTKQTDPRAYNYLRYIPDKGE